MFSIEKFEKMKEDFTLFVKVSEYCNIKCSFCYQNAPDGDMLNTEDKIKTCLDNIDLWIERLVNIRSSKDRKNNIGTIVMFGGEPTVNPVAIERICNHLSENHMDKREFLKVTMTTNGTIYSKKITDSLFKAFNKKVGIMVSCDGAEEESDLNRKFKLNNQSVFKQVQANIEKYNDDDNLYGVLLSSVHTDEHKEEDYLTDIKSDISKKAKDDKSYRRRRFLEFHKDKNCLTNPETKKTLKRFADIFYDNGKYIIDNMNNENKEKSAQLLKDTFRLCSASSGVHSCVYTKTIDAKGNFNYCNSNPNLPNGIYDPTEMKKYVLDLNVKDDLYECSYNNKILTNLFRIKKQRALAILLGEKFTINYEIPSLTISDKIDNPLTIKNLNSFVECSTQEYFLINKEAEKYFVDEEILKKIVFLDEIDPLSVNIEFDGKCYINIFEKVQLTDFSELFFWLFNVESIEKMNEFLLPILSEIN